MFTQELQIRQCYKAVKASFSVEPLCTINAHSIYNIKILDYLFQTRWGALFQGL